MLQNGLENWKNKKHPETVTPSKTADDENRTGNVSKMEEKYTIKPHIHLFQHRGNNSSQGNNNNNNN